MAEKKRGEGSAMERYHKLRGGGRSFGLTGEHWCNASLRWLNDRNFSLIFLGGYVHKFVRAFFVRTHVEQQHTKLRSW